MKSTSRRATPSLAPKHAKHYRWSHAARTTVCCIIIAVLAFSLAFAGALYLQIVSKINNRAVDLVQQPTGDGNNVSADDSNLPLDPYADQPINLLIVGQDTRDGDNAAIAGTLANEHQADTTIVVQIAADRSYINMVSIPRDSIIDQPSCVMSDGSTMPARSGVMFNSVFATAYNTGGDLSSAISCTVYTVNQLTGLSINQFVVVDFAGMSKMIDALGGVDVCIPTDVYDKYSGLNVSAGAQHLSGLQATQYARTRHGLGDGSDVMRTTRQQYLMKRLVKTALEKNMLTQSNELYQFALTALDSLSISSGLADVNTLMGLASTFSSFDISHMYTRTIPVTQDPDDKYRVVWASTADDVWAKLRNNEPLMIDSGASTDASSTDASSSASTDSSDSSTDSSSASDPTTTSVTGGTSTDSTGASGSSSDSSSSSSTGATSTSATSSMTTQERIDYYEGLGATYDESTKVITYGSRLIDPESGGTVDSSDGTIRDPDTGYAMGIAYDYLTLTYCPSLA